MSPSPSCARRLVVALLSIAAFPGCDGEPAAVGGAATGSAIVLLTIDTLRADRLGIGGDPAGRTPTLDRLARRGTQWSTAIATAPLTLPSHASILSGRIPPEHGARDNGLFRVRDDVPLLSEALRDAGWDTAAFLAAFPLAARFGLERGFDTYHDAPGARPDGSTSSFVERPARAVNADVLEWLSARSPGGRLFAWVHYFDPHAPYEPPRPWTRAVGGDRYRGEIAFTDRETAHLLRTFRSRFRDLRVCATADHGESLGEHGEETHGVFVYEATTRVPLILAGPGVAEGRIDGEPVSLLAVPSTILAWVGADPKAAAFPVPSLPREGGRRPSGGSPGTHGSDEAAPDATDALVNALYTESLYPKLRHGWASLRGMRSGNLKVVRAPQPEVYELAADPGETRNLFGSADAPPEAVELLAYLADPAFADGAAPAADPAVEEALRSLGYAGVTRPGAPDERLPDPKDRIRIERLLSRAGSAVEGGSLGIARAAISQALSVDPRSKETQLLLARVEAASGSYERAFEIFDYCLTLPPASFDAVVHYEAGRVALDAGRLDRAEKSFAHAVEADPLNVDARFNWGVAAYRDGRRDDAAERWRGALALDPSHPPARRWLPEVDSHANGESES